MGLTVPADFGSLGDHGRRALVIVLPGGAIVFATDAEAAGHAAAALVDLLTGGDRARLAAPWQWALELSAEFPGDPTEGCPLHMGARGAAELAQVVATFVGTGFVRPTLTGYECGAVIVGPASRQVRMLQPETPCLLGAATVQH